MAKGKYHEWLTEAGLVTLEGFARDGLSDEQIAHNMGITTTTYYEWIKRFPAISGAIKKGKAPVDYEVENALLKRALGYYYEETVTDERFTPDGEVEKNVRTFRKHQPADVAAIIFWLKNRRSDRWKEKPTEISKNDQVKVIIDV